MRKFRPKDLPDLSESSSFSEDELFSSLAEKKGTSLFLGRYSLNQVAAVLRKRSFFKDAKKRKLWPMKLDLDSSEYPRQRFRIFFKQKKPENMVVDLKIMEGVFHPKKKMTLGISLSEYNFLILEWLTLQNPLMSFLGEKTPLPGQKHPGLGLKKKIVDIFIHLARITRKDGLLISPAYFHNALLFSRYFFFINPEKSGEVQAIRRSFPDVPFKQLAWIVHLNCMKDNQGKEYEWMAEEEIYPLNKALSDYFESKDYRKIVEESEKRLSFQIDWDCYKKRRNEIKPEIDRSL
jgi:uncharacterized LabA/DUF88 family protein